MKLANKKTDIFLLIHKKKNLQYNIIVKEKNRTNNNNSKNKN